MVLAEVLQGFREDDTVRKLEPYFRDMRYFAPVEPQTYLDAAWLYRRLRITGITVRSTIDCLIACLAAKNGAPLLAKDRDMDRIIDSGLCDVKRALSPPS